MKPQILEELQEKFRQRYNEVPNKKILIENEIAQIDIYIRNERITKPLGSKLFSPSPMQFSHGKHVFELEIDIIQRGYLSETFLKYLYENEETFYEDKEHPSYNKIMYAIKQAYEFAKYYVWLKEAVNKPKLIQEKITFKLNHEEKMLALHYLGLKVDTSINTQENYAEIIFRILGMSRQNTRKNIGLVALGKNEVRTKENLEKVSKLFESYNFFNIASDIKNNIK